MRGPLITMPYYPPSGFAFYRIASNGNEVAGHDVLPGDEGLLNELEDIVVGEMNNRRRAQQ